MNWNLAHRFLIAAALTLVLGGAMVAASGVLAALPAVLMFLLLLADHYLGFEWIERSVTARAPTVGSGRAPVDRAVRTRSFPVAARGSDLIALSLAKRPPPALSI